MSMPVSVTGLRDLRQVCFNEGRKTVRAYNSAGQVPFPTVGNTTGTAWRAATPPTTTANAWYRAQAPIVPVVPGRAQVVYSIEVETTGTCDLALLQFFDRKQALDSGGGGVTNLDYLNATHSGSLAAAGRYRWEWPEGLIVRSGERMDLYYVVTGTTGVNWQCAVEGYDITDDFDFDLPALLVIGDSIGGVTPDTTDVRGLLRPDGTMSGMWPFLVKHLQAAAGRRFRVINLSLGGTSSSDWDTMAAAGKLDGMKAAAMIVNLGMNDAAASTLISTAAGVDGGTKKAIKHLVSVFRRANPNSPAIVNQITDTDLSARLANVSSGIYSGTPRLTAYRTDIAAAVSEMAALGWKTSLAATDTAYSASSSAAFVASEASAGSRTHPNGTVGQPAMATIINAALTAALTA